jgi:hypothetical protein
MTEPNATQSSPRFAFVLLVGLLFASGIAAGLAWSRWERPATTVADPVVAAPDPAPASDKLAAEPGLVAEELRALRTELAELRAAKEERPSERHRPHEVHAAKPSERSQHEGGEATLAYWNRLNDVMAREAAMRAAPPKLTADNALSFVTGSADAYTYAAGAIRALDPAGVDPQATALAQEIAVWYDQGAANSREAGSLLQSNDVAARQGQSGKTWKTSAEEHRKQCLEINKRGERLRGELSHKYGLKFPKLL